MGRPVVFQAFGQLVDVLNLVDGDALVGGVQYGVVQIGIGIALRAHDALNSLIAPAWPTVGGEHDIGLLPVAIQGVVDVFRPDQWITDQSTAQGVDVMDGADDVFSCPECLELREPGVHLCRRLGAGSALELHFHTVDGQGLEIFLDVAIGFDQAHVA
ncbi:hypothetical protein D3C84_715030 [compost metagenome]